MTSEILDAISGEVYGVWFLIGAALVFWMQAGFAMVETGFTRAKNAGNILMKNLMDFCIGTVVFILLGFGLLLGEDMVGLIGKPGFDIFTDYANFDWSNFVFNLVFCATTATIVSGAMAERTKFISYCVYSAIISAVIYPIEAHWTWGGGWLAQMGFHDFAGSNCIHMVGAIVIGAVAGVLVVFGVWLLDYKLHIDDPVGAVAVHCLNGIWGTIAVGLFATDTAPAFARGIGDGVTYGANQIAAKGLFYGGGFKQLGIQFVGMGATILWTAVTITIAFLLIKKIFGLRVSEEEEIVGLDSCEHGLPSAYAGFSIVDVSNTMTMDVNENTDLGVADYDKASDTLKNVAVKVAEAPVTASPSGIYKVVIIAKLARFEILKKALNDLGVTGMTMNQVMGCGIQKGAGEMYRGVELDATLLPKVKVEVVVSKIPVSAVIEAAKKALYTGHIGDGKIFVYSVDKVVKVRTGEEDFAALQDVE